MIRSCLIAVLVALGWVASAQAAVLETNEWNSLVRPGWSANAAPVIDSSMPPSPSGGSALKMTCGPWTQTVSQSCGRVDFTSPAVTAANDLYQGHFIRYSPDFIFHPIGTKLDLQFMRDAALPGTTTGRDNVVITILPNGNGMVFTEQLWNAPQTQNRFINVSNTIFPLVRDRQYWFEWHLRLNDVGVENGILEVWIDDQLIMSYSNITYRTTNSPWGIFQHSLEFGGGGTVTLPVAQYAWYDHTVISTTRIGMPTTVADTASPSIPASVAINGSVLTWAASTDSGTGASGVASYDVFRCGPIPCTAITAITNRNVTNFTDTTQVPGQSYAYSVRANDVAGNSSAQSAQVTLSIAPTTFKNTLFADSFTRADNADLGAGYDPGYLTPNKTNATIISNDVRGAATNSEDPKSYETVNSVSLPGAQWCQFTMGAFAGTEDRRTGCLVRAAAPTTITGYWCYARKTATNTPVHNSAIQTLHSGGAGDALIATDSTTVWGPGDIGRCEAEGSTIRFIRIPAGQTVNLTIATASNAEFSTGRCGINMWMNTGGTLANATITDLSCGGFSSTTTSIITLDSVSNSATTNTANTISLSHTIGSCSNRALVVSTQARDDASASDTAVSTVTFGGTDLTKIRADRITDSAPSANIGSELWYMVAPPSGSATVQVTWAGALSRVGVGSSISLCGVNQLTPLDAQSGATSVSGTTISSTITTVADNAAIVDTFVSRPGSGVSAVGAGQTSQVLRTVGSTVDVGLSTVLIKTPAGAETMDWTRASGNAWAHSAASFKPAEITPVVAPTITSLLVDTTGLNVTHGPTTSTTIRIVRGDNVGIATYNTFHDISQFPAGRFTKSGGWEVGLDYLCVHPIDSAGTENTATGAYGCVNNSTGPSAGFSAPLRTTPAVLSNALPNTVLPSGTTSRTISFNTDIQATCKYDINDVPYDSMSNAMTVNTLAASAIVTGLTDNTTTLYYGRCRYTNQLGQTYDNTSSIVITVQVAAAPSDTTLPSTVTNLSCTITGQCVWTAATDNVAIRGYRISLSTDACATSLFVASPTSPAYNFTSLGNNVTYCAVVRAEDTSGNLSAADSNQYTFTTPSVPDVQPPSTMTNLHICDVAFSLSQLCYDQPTDDRGPITTTIQGCYTASCTNFTIVAQTSSGVNSLIVPIIQGSVNRFVGYHSDGTNRSVADSNILEFTPQVGATTAGVCNCRNKNSAN